MKIKLKDLKPNPFKKYIHDGKFDKERLATLNESLEHGTLPQHFRVRKKNETYEQCSGHHTLEVLRKKYGNEYKVDCEVVSFSDEQMLIDMVRENITQRDTDFQDTRESVVLARGWLQSKAGSVKQFNSAYRSGQHKKGQEGIKKVLNLVCVSIANVNTH